MVVHLHTGRDTHLPSPHQNNDLLSPSSQNHHKNNNHHHSALKPPRDSISSEIPRNHDDDFLAELTHHMSHFMLQDDHHSFHSSSGESKQGSSEGSSHEPSPPATPENREKVIGKFEKRGDSRNEDNRGYEIQNSESNNGLCSYQSLIREQIQAIEETQVKQQEQSEVLSQKQSPQVHRKSQQKTQQFQKKGGGNGGRRSRVPQRAAGPQQGGEGMRAVFLDGSGFRGGTGVFLPPAAASTTTTNANSSQSSKKQGKGCSTVLIPARVVHALQLHFDQMAATSRPKAAAFFPPLHDVLVSNKDRMYSLEMRESREATTTESTQNDMILPQEWTY